MLQILVGSYVCENNDLCRYLLPRSEIFFVPIPSYYSKETTKIVGYCGRESESKPSYFEIPVGCYFMIFRVIIGNNLNWSLEKKNWSRIKEKWQRKKENLIAGKKELIAEIDFPCTNGGQKEFGYQFLRFWEPVNIFLVRNKHKERNYAYLRSISFFPAIKFSFFRCHFYFPRSFLFSAIISIFPAINIITCHNYHQYLNFISAWVTTVLSVFRIWIWVDIRENL